MQRLFVTTLVVPFAFALSGCGGPIFAGMTFAELTTAGSLISTATTGKGLGDHAMDAMTGRDCRVFEALVRDDRRLCERKNSPAVAKDWNGVVSLDGSPDKAGSNPNPRNWQDG